MLAVAARNPIMEGEADRQHPAIRNLLANVIFVNDEDVSKVVNSNGDPLVVYHGSAQWFNEFNNGVVRPSYF